MDFFVSYKSEDVTIARMISEQMRASGAGVWFAEYNILLEGRDHFLQEIDHAIGNCRFGICFTNNHYLTSEYCCREMELLLKHLGPERIIEIALPPESLPHEVFPDLKKAMYLAVPVPKENKKNIVEYEDERSAMLSCSIVKNILAYIQKSSAIPLTGCNCEVFDQPDLRIYQFRGVKYSLDFSGWTVKSPSFLERLIGIIDGNSPGPRYFKSFPAGRLWGHLIIGNQDVQRKKIRIGSADDREYYDENLSFARHYYKNILKQKCIGVHLLFLEGYSHSAFTTLFGSGMGLVMGNPQWNRLYSVVLKGRRCWNRDKEFAFFFFFRGSLNSFLRITHIMDKLVLSFRRNI